MIEQLSDFWNDELALSKKQAHCHSYAAQAQLQIAQTRAVSSLLQRVSCRDRSCRKCATHGEECSRSGRRPLGMLTQSGGGGPSERDVKQFVIRGQVKRTHGSTIALHSVPTVSPGEENPRDTTKCASIAVLSSSLHSFVHASTMFGLLLLFALAVIHFTLFADLRTMSSLVQLQIAVINCSKKKQAEGPPPPPPLQPKAAPPPRPKKPASPEIRSQRPSSVGDSEVHEVRLSSQNHRFCFRKFENKANSEHSPA